MSDDTVNGTSSNALSLFDQLKNSVSHNVTSSSNSNSSNSSVTSSSNTNQQQQQSVCSNSNSNKKMSTSSSTTEVVLSTAKEDKDNSSSSSSNNILTKANTTNTVKDKGVVKDENHAKDISEKSIKKELTSKQQNKELEQRITKSHPSDSHTEMDIPVECGNIADNCKDATTHLASALSSCLSLSLLPASALTVAKDSNTERQAQAMTTIATSTSSSSDSQTPSPAVIAAKVAVPIEKQKDNNSVRLSNAVPAPAPAPAPLPSQACTAATTQSIAEALMPSLPALSGTNRSSASATIVNTNLLMNENKTKGTITNNIAHQINGNCNKQVVASVNAVKSNDISDVMPTNNNKIATSVHQKQQQQQFPTPSLPPPAAPSACHIAAPFSLCGSNGKGNKSKRIVGCGGGASSIGIVHGTKRSAVAASSATTAPCTTTLTTSVASDTIPTISEFTTPANVAQLQQQQHQPQYCMHQNFGLPLNALANVASNVQSNGMNMISPAGAAASHQKLDITIRSQLRQQAAHHQYHNHYQHLNHLFPHHYNYPHHSHGATINNRINNNAMMKKTAVAAAAGLLRNADGTPCTDDSASKKKRCTDRYDSSESSDSGVATLLSCTDSNTGSSEDASEPGSPYSPQSNLGDDHTIISTSPPGICNKKMPPHSMLATTSSSTTGTNTTGTSTPMHTTVAVANSSSGNNNNNSTNSNQNTAKLKQPQSPSQKCYSTATPPPPSRNSLPTLQWPWNSTSGLPATNTLNSNGMQNKKRTSVSATTDGATKKQRISNATHTGVHDATTASSNLGSNSGGGVTALKRLKAAAMEESQTKITGYFKSQMKAQIHQNTNAGKRTETSTPIHNTSSNNITTSSLTMSAPNTTASLNKYFNILAQLEKGKENNSRDAKCAYMPAVVSASPNSIMVQPSASGNSITATTIATSTTQSPSLPPAASTAANLTLTSTTTTHVALPTPPSMPIPALKKIERSKPTKIAQVAPNLRKTPMNGNYSSPVAGKSPPKKHVAIAPRTPEMKQQQQQQQVTTKADVNKHVATPPTSQQMPPTNQPAVLLTAIRLPPQTAPAQPQAPSQLKPSVATPKMATATTAPPAGPTAAAAPNPTLYQLPVQLPNLVQQAAAAQYFLNGTVFKLQQFTTATTTTATSAVSAGAGTSTNPFNLMSANDLQEVLLKQQQQFQQQQHQLQLQQQQQKAAAAVANANAASSFQEIFQQQIAAAIAANHQQQQQQQQFQQLQRLGATTANIQQPVFMATPAGLLLNAASLPAMLAQAAAALTVSTNQQQQQQQKSVALQQPQQLPALQPIQSNPLPALSSIFASNAQQQQHEQNELQQQQFQHQQQLAQLALAQQQQYITATQPPPLSAVTITNTASSMSSNGHQQQQASTVTASASVTQPTTKLAIVKAATANQFPTLSSQPPPLVTISNAKARTQTSSACTSTGMPSGIQSKPSALAKPYQKRGPKAASTTAQQPQKGITSGKNKITAGGKIIATPTTPPPLVPTLSSAVCKELNSLRATVPPIKTNKHNVLPTPALVSIGSPKAATPKMAPALISTGPAMVANFKSVQQPQHLVKAVLAPAPALAPSTTTSDLFDLIKNSNGAISITAPTNFCSNSNSYLSSSTADSFAKVKDEPMEDKPLMLFETKIKQEMPTSFSGHLLSSTIKNELLEEVTKMCESNATNSNLHHECSSSSFSSNCNSVSSAADLSLEASTPQSLTSSSCSAAPSPAPSMLASVASPRRSPPLPPPQSSFDSNFSNSCATSVSSTSACRASSQDLLSELVTSSCISSGASVSNMSMGRDSPRKLEEDKDTVVDEKRNLPTPESGIGGSLSNSESSSSVSAMSNSTSKSAAVLLDSVNLMSIDSNSPPPTPLASSSSNSSDSIASNAPSPASPNDTMGLSESSNASAVPSPIIETRTPSPSSSSSVIDTSNDASNAMISKFATSPMLTQPKTIRFPAESGFRHGPKGAKRHDGVCYWDKCNKKHESSSKLLDHMQTQHVNTQTGPFACLWVGCKVYSKKSCSRSWLERHVLSHGGSKQFKCIVEGCGLRFGSQLALQKHVNSHFTATETKESTNKRTSDPPVPKQLRKNGKKLRYRRQPFSARMFDFFDAGIMEGLQHRLRQIQLLTGGSNGSITFQGKRTMQRTTFEGKVESFVRWWPQDMYVYHMKDWVFKFSFWFCRISDEWLPDSVEAYNKTVVIRQMKPMEKIRVEMLLTAAYKRPYSANLFGNFEESEAAKSENENEDETDDGDDDEDENEDDEDNDQDSDSYEESANDTETDNTDSSSSQMKMKVFANFSEVISIANLQMQPRKKHPRKPQKRIAPTM